MAEFRVYAIFGAVIPLLLFTMLLCHPFAIAVAVGLLSWGAVYFAKCWLAASPDSTGDAPAPQKQPSPFEPHKLLRQLATATRGNPLIWLIVVPGWIACFAVIMQSGIVAMGFFIMLLPLWVGGQFQAIFVEAPRTHALRAVAKELGLRFQECPSFAEASLQEWTARFEMLPDRQSTYSLNWIQGEWRGLRVDIFDFHSNSFPIDDRDQDVPLMTVCFRNDAIKLPSFTLRSCRLMHHAAGRSGDAGTGVPPEVNQEFVVQGEGPEIGSLFSPDVVGFVRNRPELVVEGGEGRFARYRDRKYLAPEEMPQFLEETLALVTKLCNARRADHDSTLATGCEETSVNGGASAGG